MQEQKANNPIQKFTQSIMFVILCFALFNTAHAGTLSKPLNNLGLVGYWSFEDATGTTATDFSGNGNTGTLTNMNTNTAWVDGKQGKGLSFDGVDDYVNIGNKASLSFSGSHTISAWVYPTAEGAEFVGNVTGTVIYEKEGGLVGQALTWGNGRFNFMVNNGGVQSVWGNSGKALNQWYFVTGVYDGKIHLYINGVEEIVSGDVAFVPNTALTALIGKHSSGDRYFPGTLDDVRIYSRALSATEISTLYNQTFHGTVTTKSSNNNGLVGYWSFEDATGTQATDFSGNGNAGTLTNMNTNTAWVDGKQGKGLQFDGVDDFVSIPNNTITGPTSSVMTLSVWIKTSEAVTTNKTIISKGAPNSTVEPYALILASGSGTVSFLQSQGSSWNTGVAGNSALNDGLWHLVTATNDGVNAKMYVDGILNNTDTSPATYLMTTTDVLGIGSQTIGTSAMTYGDTLFNGIIDDVRIYSRALSSSEVSTLYNSTKSGHVTLGVTPRNILDQGLVGHWTFDGKDLTTTTAIDTSGNNNNGTLTNGPLPVRGKVGQALSFDGVDDYVEASHNGILDNAEELTFSAWIKPATLTNSLKAIASKYSNTDGVGIILETGDGSYGGGDDIIFGVTTNTPDSFAYTNSGVLSLNQWVHVVGVYKGYETVTTDRLEIYINGIKQNTLFLSPSAIPSVSPITGYNLIIGNETAYVRKFNGSIDDVRVYDHALSASEVKTLYNLGR